MRYSRRYLAAGAAAVATCLLVGACGGAAKSASSKPAPAHLAGQSVTYWASVEGTGPSQTTSTLSAQFRDFTKQTAVKVNLQVIPWSDLLQKILTSVTSGNGPDVMEIGNTWSPSFAASGGFLSFTPSVFSQIGGSAKFSHSAQLGMRSSAYGIAPIPMARPMPRGGKDVETFPAGINLAVPSSTKHQAAALALVKYLTSTSAQTTINQTYGTFPPVLSAQKAAPFQTGDEKTLGSALLHSFELTVPYTVLVVGIAWAIGMLAATGLSVEFKGRSWLRSALLIPYALAVYVAVIVWSFMLQRDTGAVNVLLVHDTHLLSTAPFWLLGGKAFWSMVAAAVWRWFPFAFLILIAALQAVPCELYEAAAVDGASAWRQFRSITLPSLRNANLVLVLVMFLWNFNDFNTPFVLFGSAPPTSADLLSLHIYIVSFQSWNFGLGSAMSVLLMLFLFVISMIYLRVLRRGGDFNV